MNTRPSLLGVLAALLVTAATAHAQVLFNNTNTGGVANGGSAPVFTLNGPATITQLQTYHWNFGRGSFPGSIAIRHQSGTTYGPFRATSTSGQGGAPNVNWVANMNVTVPAGSYTVLDSDPATWSQNGQSQGRGFVIVRGTAAAGPAPLIIGRPTVSLPPDAGRNSRFSPTLLSPIRSVPNQTITDTIGSADTDDWYQIVVTGFNGFNRPSAVTVTLATTGPGVTLELYRAASSSPFEVRGPGVPSPKVISANLPPDTYLVHVVSTSALAGYTLNLAVNPNQ